MSFQDEMRTAYHMSHSPAALEARQVPGDHDYQAAGQYLDLLKRQIRNQLRRNPPNCFTATGSVILAGPKGYEQPSDFLLLDGISSTSPFRQSFTVYLTKKGYVFLQDLLELAHQEGISLSFSLDYQGRQYPLPIEARSLQTRHQLPHTNRLTETRPKIRVSYAFRVA